MLIYAFKRCARTWMPSMKPVALRTLEGCWGAPFQHELETLLQRSLKQLPHMVIVAATHFGRPLQRL